MQQKEEMTVGQKVIWLRSGRYPTEAMVTKITDSQVWIQISMAGRETVKRVQISNLTPFVK